MGNKKIFGIVTILFAVVFAVIFILSLVYVSEIETLLGSNLQNYGGAILFLLGLFIELIPNYLSPHLGIINAYALNLNLDTTLAFLLLGSVTGSLLGFELGNIYGVKLADNFVSREKIKKIEKALNSKGRWGVLMAALSPIPYFPIVLGSIKLSWKNFVIFGVIPRSIGIVLMALIIFAF